MAIVFPKFFVRESTKSSVFTISVYRGGLGTENTDSSVKNRFWQCPRVSLEGWDKLDS